jgi:hypothetical protein
MVKIRGSKLVFGNFGNRKLNQTLGWGDFDGVILKYFMVTSSIYQNFNSSIHWVHSLDISIFLVDSNYFSGGELQRWL